MNKSINFFQRTTNYWSSLYCRTAAFYSQADSLEHRQLKAAILSIRLAFDKLDINVRSLGRMVHYISEILHSSTSDTNLETLRHKFDPPCKNSKQTIDVDSFEFQFQSSTSFSDAMRCHCTIRMKGHTRFSLSHSIYFQCTFHCVRTICNQTSQNIQHRDDIPTCNQFSHNYSKDLRAS